MKAFALPLLLCAAALLAPLGSAQALPKSAHGQEEDQQRGELKRLTAEAQKKRDEARKLRGREQGVLRQLHKLEIDLGRARAAVAQYTRRENQLTRDIGVVQGDLDHTRAARMMTQEQLAKRLRAAYRFRRDRELEFLLASRSFADLDTRMRWVGVIAGSEERMVNHLGVQAESINVAKVVLEQKKTEIEQVRESKQKEQKIMEGLRQQRQSSVKQIQTQRKSYESAAAELEQSAKQIKRMLDELERKRLEEQRRRQKAGQPPSVPEGQFGHGRGSLPWPVRGSILENFGRNVHPKFGTVTLNNGIDIEAAEGSEIHAVEKGVVEIVDWVEGYGQTIILNHGGGFYTLYSHCGTVSVAQGQQVVANQTIGTVGDTGSIRGAELHFEVRQGDKAVDPLDWLR